MNRWTGLVLIVGLAAALTPVHASADFESARAAYDRGEFATALAAFRELAGKGNVPATYQLGLMSANGDGVPQDHVEAVRWYRRAAAKKNADAQRSLGMCFATGQGVGKDLVSAALWLNLAVSQNDALAQRLRQRLEVELTPAQSAQAEALARQWNGEESVTASAGATACEGVDPSTPVAVGGAVTSPRLVRRIEPAYPPLLRAARLRGRVTLKAVIDASGDVRDVEVLSSQNASFSKAAVDAVKQWKYDPARREGCTVPVALTVGLEFNGG